MPLQQGPGLPIGGQAGSIFLLRDALDWYQTANVVLGCRASGPSQVASGALARQEQACGAAVRSAGGRVVAVVGNIRAQNGKLSSGRPDLLQGRQFAEQHQAVLCFYDLTRLFRPAAFHDWKNPGAVYTPGDFAELRAILGDTPLAVIEPPELTLKELHSRKTRRGMKQARAEGRAPGPPCSISAKLGDAILFDRHKGLSLREIAERYGLTRSAVQRSIARTREVRSSTSS